MRSNLRHSSAETNQKRLPCKFWTNKKNAKSENSEFSWLGRDSESRGSEVTSITFTVPALAAGGSALKACTAVMTIRIDHQVLSANLDPLEVVFRGDEYIASRRADPFTVAKSFVVSVVLDPA